MLAAYEPRRRCQRRARAVLSIRRSTTIDAVLAGAPLYPLVGHPSQVLRRPACGPRLTFMSVPQAQGREFGLHGQRRTADDVVKLDTPVPSRPPQAAA